MKYLIAAVALVAFIIPNATLGADAPKGQLKNNPAQNNNGQNNQQNNGQQNQKDDGQKNQKDDGDQNQKDDSQKNQKDDGQKNQKDDGDQNQKDDSQKNQKDDGQRNQKDNGQANQKDDGQLNQVTLKGVGVDDSFVRIVEMRGGKAIEQKLPVAPNAAISIGGKAATLDDLKRDAKVDLKLSKDRKQVVEIRQAAPVRP